MEPNKKNGSGSRKVRLSKYQHIISSASDITETEEKKKGREQERKKHFRTIESVKKKKHNGNLVLHPLRRDCCGKKNSSWVRRGETGWGCAKLTQQHWHRTATPHVSEMQQRDELGAAQYLRQIAGGRPSTEPTASLRKGGTWEKRSKPARAVGQPDLRGYSVAWTWGAQGRGAKRRKRETMKTPMGALQARKDKN